MFSALARGLCHASRFPKFKHSAVTKFSTTRLSVIGKPVWDLTRQQITPFFKKCTQSVRLQSSVASTAVSLHKTVQYRDKIVGYWLLGCSGMVFVAVILGGVTRLTESGLSMVTWNLLVEKMPTSNEQWIVEFEKYKQYPEFQLKNYDITLAEFKRIWWMEYAHRQWGRLIGTVFLVPAVVFWAKGFFNSATKKRVLAFGTLIGLQGLMGWYMVKSGLQNNFDDPNDVPRVSQYRLASHLGLAFGLYTLLLGSAMAKLLPPQAMPTAAIGNARAMKRARLIRHLALSSKALVFLTALSGAFVAGLDAGLVYNTYPKMADHWIPCDLLAFSPTLRNFFENPTTVQFDHRRLGETTVAVITTLFVLSRRASLPPRAVAAATVLVGLAWLQVGLGITTLLSHVPTDLAATHQSNSLLLLSAAIWLSHELKLLKYVPK